MKILNVKRYAMSIVFILISILFAGHAVAQSNVANKELIGVWLLESMQYDGENKILCGTSQGKTKTVNVAPNYAQIKVYRANGEYACAEIVKLKDGKYRRSRQTLWGSCADANPKTCCQTIHNCPKSSTFALCIRMTI